MKKSIFFGAILFIAQCNVSLLSQSNKVYFKSQITDTTKQGIATAYLRFLIPDNAHAIDSAFTDELGNINHGLPLTYGETSIKYHGSLRIIVNKISPNIITKPNAELSIVYNYPENGNVFFIDAKGKRYANHSKLSSGLYQYYLQFEDGKRSDVNQLVITNESTIHVQLENIQNSVKNGLYKSSLQQSITSNLLYVHVIKDGYITHIDTMYVDSTLLENDYELKHAAKPTANFSVSGDMKVGKPVVFNASTSTGPLGEELIYSWNFGNEKTGQAEIMPHQYLEAGDYKVLLTVTGSYGAKDTVSQLITVVTDTTTSNFNGKIQGFINNETGVAVPGANVSLIEDDINASSDGFGKVNLSDLPVGIPLHLTISATNYVSQVIEIVIPHDTTPAVFYTTLKERNPALTLENIEFGGDIESDDGTTVTLPVEGFLKEDGSIARGDVDVSVTPVDVAYETSSFPGTFNAYRTDGDDGVLLSYGVSEFHFEQDGEELELAPGKKATITIPIYTSGATLGDQIPLWSINEDNGTWVEEGVGTVVSSAESPTGLALQAEVGHFSWWNCDDFDDFRRKKSLCWRWECSSAICVKVKVGCWMSGAQRGGSPLAQRGFNMRESASKVREEIPPVFEVRQYVGEDGSDLRFPVNSEVFVEARALDSAGNLYIGDFVVLQSDLSDSMIIELILADGSDTSNLPLDYTYSDYLGLLETLDFNTPIATSGSYCIALSDGVHPALDGVFIVRYNDSIIASGNSDDDFHTCFDTDAGMLETSLTPELENDDGNFNIGIYTDDSKIINSGDTINDLIFYKKDVDSYYFNGNENEFIEMSLIPHDPSKRFSLQLLDSLGNELFDLENEEIIAKLPSTENYTLNVYNYLTDTGRYTLTFNHSDFSDTSDLILNYLKEDNLGLLDSLYYRAYIDSSGPYKAVLDIYKYPYLRDGEYKVSQHGNTLAVGTLSDKGQKVQLDTGIALITVTGNVINGDGNFVVGMFDEDTTNITLGDTVPDRFGYHNDTNYYKFNGTENEYVSFELTGAYYPRHKKLLIYAMDGTELLSTTNAETVFQLPTTDEYIAVLTSTAQDTGVYTFITTILSPDTLDYNSLNEIALNPNESSYYIMPIPKQTYTHFSLMSDAGLGTFDLWNSNQEFLTGYSIYSANFNISYCHNLDSGNYFLKINNTDATTLYANILEAQSLALNSKGLASFSDTLTDMNEINAFLIDCNEGDGLHGILLDDLINTPPGSMNLYYQQAYTNSEPLYLTRYGLHQSLDSTILNETSVRVTDREDSVIILLVHSGSPGIYNFNFHKVTPSVNIIVDDDFSEYPSATTSSLVAAAYAAQDNATITIANGQYNSYIPVTTYNDSINLVGQSKENVFIRNVQNRTSNPAIWHRSPGGTIENMTISTGNNNGYSLNIGNQGIKAENIDVEKLPGRDLYTCGIVASGNDIQLRNINISNSIWGINTSSSNLVMENCSLYTQRYPISSSGDNIIIRNNYLNVDDDYTAMSIRSGHGRGNQLIDSNIIVIDNDSASSGSGVIDIDEAGYSSDSNVTVVSNNTITATGDNAAFDISVSYAPNKVIVENNTFNSTLTDGSKALICSGVRSTGNGSIIVRNNTFNNIVADRAIWIYGLDGIDSEQQFGLYNNSFRIGSSVAKDTNDRFIHLQSFYSTFTDTANVYMINNIFEGNDSTTLFKFDNDFYITFDYNVVYKFKKYIADFGNIISTGNDVLSNPLFTDDLLHVSPGSPANNNGASNAQFEYVPLFDLEGTARPQGGNVDIGAYETE